MSSILWFQNCFNYVNGEDYSQDSEGCDEECQWCGEGKYGCLPNLFIVLRQTTR